MSKCLNIRVLVGCDIYLLLPRFHPVILNEDSVPQECEYLCNRKSDVSRQEARVVNRNLFDKNKCGI